MKTMTPGELWQRGNNLFAVGIVALAGFAFLPESIFETEWLFKLDDILLFLLGLWAIFWYKKGNNKFTRSVKPLFFLYGALALKIVAIILENKDKEDVGDDFGGVTLFLLGSIIVTQMYIKSREIWAKK